MKFNIENFQVPKHIKNDQVYQRISKNINNNNNLLYNISQIPDNVLEVLKILYNNKTTEYPVAEAVFIPYISFTKN